MIFEEYYNQILNALEKIKNTQKEKIAEASKIISQTIIDDGIIYIFGCGHSHLIALDNFYRAGGLCNVSAMLDTDLMLHNGAAKSSRMEKMSGIAESILDRYYLSEKDTLIVVSTSGKNSVPVEMAQFATARGIKTISLVSSSYFSDKTDKSMLYECSTMYIDNCVPHGDAVISIEGCDTCMGSISTITSAFIMQSVILEATQLAVKSGKKPAIYKSGNVSGGSEFNKGLIQQFLPRIKHL